MGKMIALVAVVAGVYAVISFVLVKTPVLYPRWKKKFEEKFPFSMANIAHRGGSMIGPENTMYTFARGLEEGCADMLELDVRMSKDGQAVVAHDVTLGRTCGSSYENVAVADIVVGEDPDTSLPPSCREIPILFKTSQITTYHAEATTPSDSTTRLCLLSEVFERFPSVPMHVDIKDADYGFVCEVLGMIEKYNRGTITFVGSSNPKNTPIFRRYFQNCTKERRRRFRVFANIHQFLITHVYFYLGILPFVDLEYDVFSIPVFTTTMRQGAMEDFGFVKAVLGTYLMTSPVMWTHLQHRGIAVLGWVLNTEQDFAQAKRWPLNGIMTDNPILLHNFLTAYEQDGENPSSLRAPNSG